MQPEGNQVQPTRVTPTPAAATPPVSGKAARAARDQRASVQNHLMFSEIKDGIVVMRDGSLRMVIMASAVNFDLKSPQEQDAIEFAYQGFLNGLHFPIQIVVRSRKLDLDSYLEKLEHLQAEQQNELLGGLMEDYIYNIRGLLEEVNIMNKEFYVVVPLFINALTKETLFSKIGKLLKPNQDVNQSAAQYEQNKRGLVQRTNLVAQGLAQMGVRAVVLSTQELVELFYTAYNVDDAQNQPLIRSDDVTTAAVIRGERPAERQPAAANVGLYNREEAPPDLFEAARAREAQNGQAAAGPAGQPPAPQAPPNPPDQAPPAGGAS